MKETKDIVIGRTRSICPVCGRQLPAQRVRHGEDIFWKRVARSMVIFYSDLEGRLSISSWMW